MISQISEPSTVVYAFSPILNLIVRHVKLVKLLAQTLEMIARKTVEP